MNETCRLDRWLWAARFFKTRPLAVEAVNGGKVHIDGHRVKPSKHVSVGQKLAINRHGEHFEIIIKQVSQQRRPAKEAEMLYVETEESVTKRMVTRDNARALMVKHPTSRKPRKHERHKIIQFKRGRDT